MRRGRPDVHMVTIQEIGEGVCLTLGHVVHGIGDEGLVQRLPVHGMHAFDAEGTLEPTYGHLVHA